MSGVHARASDLQLTPFGRAAFATPEPPVDGLFTLYYNQDLSCPIPGAYAEELERCGYTVRYMTGDPGVLHIGVRMTARQAHEIALATDAKWRGRSV